MIGRSADTSFMKGGAGLLVAMLTAAAGLGACSRSTHCQPEALVLSSTSVAVGGQVTISSPAASCKVDQPTDHRYRVVLHDVSGAAFPVGSAPVTDHGQFTLAFPLPAAARPGPAHLSVTGTGLGCDDSQSCPGYGTTLTITPPS